MTRQKINPTNAPSPCGPQAVLSARQFAEMMSCAGLALTDASAVAVAVSGGGDSMALLLLLQRWCQEHAPLMRLHVLTVDHRLRPESATEARQVGAWVKNWANVEHHILIWRGTKPKTKVSETARAKRYDLMARHCARHDIHHLFLAHTLNDQTETFLLRLSAGSGLDGLAGMQAISSYHQDSSLLLVRPLLPISHDRLLATLRAAGQEWIEDPTNQNLDYARPRLRAAWEILAREGLTPERLAGTAARMSRARATITWAVDQAWAQITGQTKQKLTIERMIWGNWPDDIQVRILMRAVTQVGRKSPRLEQIEALWQDLGDPRPHVVRRTLAGAVVTRGQKRITISVEK